MCGCLPSGSPRFGAEANSALGTSPEHWGVLRGVAAMRRFGSSSQVLLLFKFQVSMGGETQSHTVPFAFLDSTVEGAGAFLGPV